MQAALDQAQCAADHNEVPVGAAILNKDGHTLAMAHNQTLTGNDPTAHAEISVLRQAAHHIGNHRLTGCVLVVTLEPCLMCLGAIIQARIAGVVFGARDTKAGALLSQINVNDLNWLNHRFWIVEGVCKEESQNLLAAFFRSRRK